MHERRHTFALHHRFANRFYSSRDLSRFGSYAARSANRGDGRGGPKLLAARSAKARLDRHQPHCTGRRTVFQGSDRLIPEFLDAMLVQYQVENGRFHLAGVSNGDISAFRKQ